MFARELESECGLLLNCLNETVGLLKVTGSWIHCKSSNMSKRVQDRHVVTIHHEQEVIYDLSDDLERSSGSLINCKSFQMRFFVQLCSS